MLPDDAMASEEAAPPPANSDTLRLYHLDPTGHTISNLSFGRLKIADLTRLNDPFEFFGEELPTPLDMDTAANIKNEVAEKFGLLCFSEDWGSSTMWSHYADRHTGICLGFDIKRTDVYPVEYEKEKLERGSFGALEPINIEMLQRRLTRKSTDWKYEREWRRIVELKDAAKRGDMHFFSFSPMLELKEVILGPGCTILFDDMERLLKKLFSAPGIYFYKARMAGKHFNLVPDTKSGIRFI